MLLERCHVLIIITKLVDVEGVDILDMLHEVPGVTEVLATAEALQHPGNVLQLLQRVLLALTGEPQLAVVTLVGQQRGDRIETQPERTILNIK